MATIYCPCGHIFSDNIDPNPNKFYLVSDARSEELAEKIIENSKLADEGQLRVNVHFFVLTAGETAFICPICNRLLIFDKESHLLKSYLQEM